MDNNRKTVEIQGLGARKIVLLWKKMINYFHQCIEPASKIQRWMIMANLKYSLVGVRGRELDVYDTKVVIRTRVTVGSILSDNSTDGVKTIFLCDVVGVQFKKSGVAIGYLQFETPSMQMNNQDNNMYSENTFTFRAGQNDVTNEKVEKVYEYVVDRIEELKYGKATNRGVSTLNPADIQKQVELQHQAEKEYQEKQLHKQQVEAYWAEHEEEKAELQQKLKALQAELNAKEQEKAAAVALKTPTAPSTAKLQLLQRELNDLNYQMGELGRFKLKEKEKSCSTNCRKKTRSIECGGSG